jgi:hypothetical protein|tara:strand:+ start:607 stop:777 length:171 start_codon:yes stop_codon:yes gene_type:complete
MVFPGLPLFITALNREVQGGDPVNLSGFPLNGYAQQKLFRISYYFFIGSRVVKTVE